MSCPKNYRSYTRPDLLWLKGATGHIAPKLPVCSLKSVMVNLRTHMETGTLCTSRPVSALELVFQHLPAHHWIEVIADRLGI